MKAWQAVLVGLIVLFAGIVVIALALPKGYVVERSIVVDAPVEVVFEQVNDLEKNVAWSPWRAEDPTIVYTFGPVTVGKGATYSWTSAESGAGDYMIVESEPNRHIESEITFEGMGQAKGYFDFDPRRDGTVEVTWSLKGENSSTFGGLWSAMMDYLVGPSFEQGLVLLGRAAETAPRAPSVSGDAATAAGTDPTGALPPLP